MNAAREVAQIELEQKRAFIREALERGLTAIMLDATQPGVDVPREHQKTANLILNFSPKFGTPLEVSEWGVVQNLRFDGSYWHECRVPWSAIFAARSDVLGQGMGWKMPDPPPVVTRRRGTLALVN